jgi:hypothetical protein
MSALSLLAAADENLMLVLAFLVARLGWYMARNPTRTLHCFTFGSEPAFGHNFGIAWCRNAGWFFAVRGSLVVLFYFRVDNKSHTCLVYACSNKAYDGSYRSRSLSRRTRNDDP